METVREMGPDRLGAQKQILERAGKAIGDQPRMRKAEAEVTQADDRAAGAALFDRVVRRRIEERSD